MLLLKKRIADALANPDLSSDGEENVNAKQGAPHETEDASSSDSDVGPDSIEPATDKVSDVDSDALELNSSRKKLVRALLVLSLSFRIIFWCRNPCPKRPKLKWKRKTKGFCCVS
jgi:hypothetical protein